MLKNIYRIESAIQALEKATNWEIQFEKAEKRNGESEIEGYLLIKNSRFAVESKTILRHAHLPQLINAQKQQLDFIVIAEHIPENIREMLREKRVNYLDIQGNGFMQSADIHIFIEGKKPQAKIAAQQQKYFSKKGLILIFHLLREKELLRKTYREISKITGISLDMISQTISKLKEQGFIRQLNEKEMLLANRNLLLEKWIEEYRNRLKPTLFLGKFRFFSNEKERNWKEIDFQGKSAWGGEAAADVLTHFLSPTHFALYTSETQKELIQNYRFLPDVNGNIEVYESFYKIDNQIVDAILVYADLLLSKRASNMETAQKIKENLVWLED